MPFFNTTSAPIALLVVFTVFAIVVDTLSIADVPNAVVADAMPEAEFAAVDNAPKPPGIANDDFRRPARSTDLSAMFLLAGRR
jgi:hypothetical protein